MTDLRTAAEMALEALDQTRWVDMPTAWEKKADAAVAALRAALAEKREPVGYMPRDGLDMLADGIGPIGLWRSPNRLKDPVPLYTAQPERQPLTHERDRPDQGSSYVEGYGYVATEALRAIERAHGIGAKHD